MKRLINFIVIILLISSGCSITKRVYQPGYHIEWKNKKSETINPLSKKRENKIIEKTQELSELRNEDNFIIEPINPAPSQSGIKKNVETKSTSKSIIGKTNKVIEGKIYPKKIKTIFSSAMKGVNLQEPSGQLFLLGVLSLAFIALGVTLLYFTTPPQVQLGSLLLLLGAICFVAFLRILAGLFAEWAFG